MVTILQFTGQGRGMMIDTTEYITILDGEATDQDREPAPGFVLDHEAQVDDDFPGWFPFDRTLKVSY